MDFIVNLKRQEDLDGVLSLPADNILVQPAGYSRNGGVGLAEIGDILARIASQGKKAILAWDGLFCESEVNDKFLKIEASLPSFDAIRFLDPGIGRLLNTECSDLKTELSLEHGSLSKVAILTWVELFKPGIEKVILSSQIPLERLQSITPDISVKTEIMGFGPLEMFYSNRKLLNRIPEPDKALEERWKIASEDRPDQLNQIFQSERGTLVFYDKLLNIMYLGDRLEEAGIDALRLEYQTTEQLEQIGDILMRSSAKEEFDIPDEIIETGGFIRDNRSNEHFVKLTNRYLKRKIEHKIGEILESAKSCYTVFSLDRALPLPQQVALISPEGKDLMIELRHVRDLKGNEYSGNLPPGIYRLDWVKYAVPGTLMTLVAP